jgi:uncharacterized repeat protein (TIGR04076 family)
MSFKNLKITCVKAEGECNRAKPGDTFYVRNAKLEVPSGQSICIFALGSILQPITAAIIKSQEGEGLLEILDQWQCPDPLAKVIFKEEKPD